MTDAWVNEYRNKRPIFESLCTEVSRIIQNSFVQSNLRCHSIDARAKEVDSFERKLKKKREDGLEKYTLPLKEITDLAGVRIIVYTIDDINLVTDFIDKNFFILEKRDVGEERIEKGQFGYQSIHYLIQLTEERLALPDFVAYRDLVSEVQVRTVLQHAWAEMEHDIQYQGSENIPKSMKRKFLSLAGLLEIADREFSSIQRDDKALKRNVLTDLQNELTRDAITRSSETINGTGLCSSNDEPDSSAQVRILLAAGNYAEAIESYNHKIDREPTSYTLFIGRARALFLIGETDPALKDLDRADELQPNNPNVSNLRSKIHNGTLATPQESQRVEGNTLVKKGDEVLRGGKPEEAFILYSDAQSIGASWPFTTFKMALAGTVAGDLTGAGLLLSELKINSGTPMEINICALGAILCALQGSEDFLKKLDHLNSLVAEKQDFNFELSPLSLIRDLDRAKVWKLYVDDVSVVFEALE